MENLYVFNRSVIGDHHIKNGFPCEDSSASWQSADSHISIAITADGHGDPSCFRSSDGSKAAVESAEICLKNFAEVVLENQETEEEFYRQIFSSQRYRQITMRHLTDSVLAEWNNRITEHFQNTPLTIDESINFGNNEQTDSNIAHIYGTTLIAGLRLPKALVLIQQGDGRCEVVFKNGSLDQPIPWDTRCEDTATTSLCDDDASVSFRSTVIDLEKTPVAACFMCSDGVEDSYRDTYEDIGGAHTLMGGVDTFCKNLICKINENSAEDFEKYLEEMLPGFSASGLFSSAGSGDDVSVAGIVDLDSIGSLTGQFKLDIQKYQLEEDLFQKESALNGKKRKHEILRKKRNEARDAYEKALESEKVYRADIQNAEIQCQKLEAELEQIRKEIKAYRQNSDQVMPLLNPKEDDYAEESNDAISNYLDAFMGMGSTVINRIQEAITAGLDENVQKEKKLLKKIEAAQQAKAKVENKAGQYLSVLEKLKKEYDEAENVFSEYDEQFRELDRMKADINQSIDRLKVQQNENDAEPDDNSD